MGGKHGSGEPMPVTRWADGIPCCRFKVTDLWLKIRVVIVKPPQLKEVLTQTNICSQLQFPDQRLTVCFRLWRTFVILLVAWHVMASLLVLATVLIGGSLGFTEDPGKTRLCDLMRVMKLT